MTGDRSADERVLLGHAVLDLLKEMDLDTREKVSVLFVAVCALWIEEKIPLELFDLTVSSCRRHIITQTIGPPAEKPQ